MTAHCWRVDRFVRDLLALPPLDASEEIELARRARAGDRDARRLLITAGMRSVALRACMRGHRGDELRDAVQSGAIGLIQAVDRFDPERGARLSTYAWLWIGAEMAVTPRREVPLDVADVPVDGPVPTDLSLLDGMPDDFVCVLDLRFGLGLHASAPMPRHAVAQRLGLTESQVRTIEGKAMRQLRARLAKVGDRAPSPRGANPP